MFKYRLSKSTRITCFIVMFVVINSHADNEYDTNVTESYEDHLDDKDVSYEEYDTIHQILQITKLEPHSMKIVIEPQTLKHNSTV